MKTKEELNVLKEEVEAVNKKLHDLTDEEFEQISGGVLIGGHDTVKWADRVMPEINHHPT